MTRCSIPRCPAGVDLVYLGRGICTHHWNELTADDAPPYKLRMVLGIEAEGPAATMEVDMSETKKTETTKAKRTKAAREPKVTREKAPKEDLVVFACRVSEAERVKFHEAAGPAGASRFARKLMIVFAAEDEAGFRTLLKEAREARQ